MDLRLTILVCFLVVVVASAVPSEYRHKHRERRDVMDSMKHAWGEVMKTLSEAGDAVVHVFKPTEKPNVVDKITEGIKGLTAQ